ncbi:MAG: CDP-diacylglycerol--glycerol-3-phosphate 3-phosphatidyltransferase [Planctomycetales bacterium]|nr:CDP-diacylglycerol--glycerol-3-phosphate 3-phosphatidyltransferase [Planctomycetales bacterium]
MATANPENVVFNVPNQLTAVRLGLSIAVFVLIPFKLYLPALIVFVIAAGTDWVDGWWARKFKQVTKLGRVFDPFVDKIIICGTFIFLAAEPDSGIYAWMAVVVMGREMLVTVLRTMVEQSGGDFSAKMAGKLKMVFQCLAVGTSLVVLWQKGPLTAAEFWNQPGQMWLFWTLHISAWLAVLSTIYSGLEYVFIAAKTLK